MANGYQLTAVKLLPPLLYKTFPSERETLGIEHRHHLVAVDGVRAFVVRPFFVGFYLICRFFNILILI